MTGYSISGKLGVYKERKSDEQVNLKRIGWRY